MGVYVTAEPHGGIGPPPRCMALGVNYQPLVRGGKGLKRAVHRRYVAVLGKQMDTTASSRHGIVQELPRGFLR